MRFSHAFKPILVLLLLCQNAGAEQAGDFLATKAGVDLSVATQASVDAIQARTAHDSEAGGTVRFLARPGLYGFEAPIYLDGAGVEIAGDGAHSTRLGAQNYYAGPILAPGVTRLESQGIDPARFRLQTPVSTQGLTTRGEVILMVTAHPAQLGAPLAAGGLIPDHWQADCYSYEFVIRLPKLTTGASAGLFGPTRPGDGMPAPWSFRYGRSSNRMALWTKNVGQAGQDRCEDEWDYPDDGDWHRVRLQKDDLAGGISVWVDGAAVAVSRMRTDGTTVKPGDKQAKHDGVTPFTVGYGGGGPPGYVPIDLGALNVSVGRKFVIGAKVETRTDGQPLTDGSFFENANRAGSTHMTAFMIPFNDAPKTHVSIASQAGRGVGFLVSRTPHFASNLRIRGLSLSTLVQAPILIGPLFDLDMRDVWSGRYSLQGVAALPIACSYTVTTDHCRFGGLDAAYVSFEQILHARETLIVQTGRDAWRLEGTDATIRECTYTFAVDGWETYVKTISQGYAGSLVLEGHMGDNENGGPAVALIDVEQSPYCPNFLLVNGFKCSTNAAPRFLRVTGFGTPTNKDIYSPGYMNIKGLNVFSGYGGIGVELIGSGWSGHYDPNGLGSAAVAGDAGGLVVMPLAGQAVSNKEKR